MPLSGRFGFLQSLLAALLLLSLLGLDRLLLGLIAFCAVFCIRCNVAGLGVIIWSRLCCSPCRIIMLVLGLVLRPEEE